MADLMCSGLQQQQLYINVAFNIAVATRSECLMINFLFIWGIVATGQLAGIYPRRSASSLTTGAIKQFKQTWRTSSTFHTDLRLTMDSVVYSDSHPQWRCSWKSLHNSNKHSCLSWSAGFNLLPWTPVEQNFIPKVFSYCWEKWMSHCKHFIKDIQTSPSTVGSSLSWCSIEPLLHARIKPAWTFYFCGLLWLVAEWPLHILGSYRLVIMVKISFTWFNMEICCFNEIELQWQKSFDHNSRADIVGTKSMLQDWQNEELPIIKHNS